jgi:hypothetical protein
MSIKRRREAASVTACLATLGLLLPAGAERTAAQDRDPSAGTPDTDAVESVVQTEQPTRGPWWTLWSWRTPHDRVVAGMITTHLYELDEAPADNQAVGVIYKGVVGATFITTHGPRGFVLALERAWLEGRLGPTRTMLGFRAGLVYGYDQRLFGLAEHTPILPYAQPMFLLRAGPVSLDFTYTWVVVSLTAGVSFW